MFTCQENTLLLVEKMTFDSDRILYWTDSRKRMTRTAEIISHFWYIHMELLSSSSRPLTYCEQFRMKQ
jgi:hypothetical protein